jgi:hypothetical protein
MITKKGQAYHQELRVPRIEPAVFHGVTAAIFDLVSAGHKIPLPVNEPIEVSWKLMIRCAGASWTVLFFFFSSLLFPRAP